MSQGGQDYVREIHRHSYTKLIETMNSRTTPMETPGV